MSIYLFNPVVALFYIIALSLFVLIKLFYLDKKLKLFIKDDIIKASILAGILFIPYLIFLLYTYSGDIFFIITVYIDAIDEYFSFDIQLMRNNNYLLWFDFSEMKDAIMEGLTNWIPNDPWRKTLFLQNQIIYSIFFIFAIMSLLLSIKKNTKNSRDLIIFGKSVIIIIIILFFLPVIFPINLITLGLQIWLIMRTLEFFCAPIIIMECFTISFIIKKAKILTIYFKYNSKVYNNLMKNKISSKFINLERFMIVIFLISSYSNYHINIQQSNYNWVGNYHYSNDQIDTIFYIKENISPGSTILVSNNDNDYSVHSLNWLYSLLNDYEYIIWDFTKGYPEAKNYIRENNIKYLLIDVEDINSDHLNYFLMNNEGFKIIYENNRNIIFETIGKLEDVPTGIFQATWNFIDEDESNSGEDIEFIQHYRTTDNCTASITARVGNHKKVLDLHVNNKTNGYINTYNYLGWGEFSSWHTSSGTIEFWWRTDHAGQESRLNIIEHLNYDLVKIRIWNYTFEYYNGIYYKVVKHEISNDTWYHIRVDFSLKEEDYLGLSADTFDLYINGVLEAADINCINPGDTVHKIQLFTKQSSSEFHTYFDAFGYSWDQNYILGENMQEIML